MARKEKALKAKKFINSNLLFGEEYECVYDEAWKKLIIFDDDYFEFVSIGVSYYTKRGDYEILIRAIIHEFHKKLAKQSYKQGQENVRREMKKVLGLNKTDEDDE